MYRSNKALLVNIICTVNPNQTHLFCLPVNYDRVPLVVVEPKT
jgi:hypothetical protein